MPFEHIFYRKGIQKAFAKEYKLLKQLDFSFVLFASGLLFVVTNY
jgi:hypothetical protein